MIEALKRKLLNMIARVVVETPTEEDDGTTTLKLSALEGEVLEEVELFQQYGLASVPLPGAEGITIFLGGDRSHGITIATEDGRYHLKQMKPGEVALYTDEGDMIHLKRERTIAILTENLEATAMKSAKITTPRLELSGDLVVSGNISGAQVSDSTGSLDALRTEYGIHIHQVAAVPGASGGPEAPPPVEAP